VLSHILRIGKQFGKKPDSMFRNVPKCSEMFRKVRHKSQQSRFRLTTMDNKRRRKHRSEHGLTRELQVTRDNHAADPSLGGSAGYPTWLRADAMERVQAVGIQAAADQVKPCRSTLYNWMNRFIAYEMTGGRERGALVGNDQLLLSMFVYIYPTATADEIATFIVNNGGGTYTRQQISQRFSDLDYTRKRSSTEAYQAFLPRNLLRVDRFFNQPPPVGVMGVQRRRLIDFDETGIFLDTTNRKYGNSHVTIRIRKPGHYTKSPKLTVIAAVEPGDPNLPADTDGSVENPRRWFVISDDPGTTQEMFADFVDHVLTDLENSQLYVDQERILLWDNLASHLTPLVYNTVYGRPPAKTFHIVPRPPYQPKYGPIEYIFAELASQLQLRSKSEWTRDSLRTECRNILSSLGRDGKLNKTFDHCGY
jgi:hypothetical protein